MRRVGRFLVAMALLATQVGRAFAETPAVMPSPSTQRDVTAILDQQKPDPAAAAKMRTDADQPPPSGADAPSLARFYYKRGETRSVLGRYADAIADAQTAITVGKGHLPPNELSLIRQLEGLQYQYLGDPKKSLAVFLIRVKEATQGGNRGSLFNSYRFISMLQIRLGDLAQAEIYVRKIETLLSEARSWKNFPMFGANWQAELYEASGNLAEAKGLYADAEAAYRKAELAKRQVMAQAEREHWPAPRSQFEFNIDSMISAQGRAKARQGRLAEAEADIRRALLGRLTAAGKYNSATAGQANSLAEVLTGEGRYAEAEKLSRSALDIYRTIGLGDDTSAVVGCLSQLASIVNLRGNAREAARLFDAIEAATKDWAPRRREPFNLNVARISSLYRTGHIDAGIAAAQALAARDTARFGADSFNAAYAHANLAIGLALAGRDSEALREFQVSMPALLSRSGGTEQDDPTSVALSKRQTQMAVERYMAVLVRMQNVPGVDAAAETLRLADVIRGRSVQQALAASGARLLAKDPATADLVRKQQDVEQQVSALLGLLNSLLALPPEARDDAAVDRVRKQIAALQTEDAKAKQDIRQRFPRYVELIDPRPPTIEEIKSALTADEALLSFYFGGQASFVWAVPKEGPVAFATIAANAGEIAAKVKQLRKALEPDVASIEQIPPFDLALANRLYDLLLKPVQSGWQGAKSLIVVTNGALGTLPLGLLTTGPSPIGPGAPLFAEYRAAPWLARTHSVSMIPSAAALLTLRRLPPGSPARAKLIGFGDPYFNAQEAAEAERQAAAAIPQLASSSSAATRGLPFRTRAAPHASDVEKTEFARLPRLPDTRAELYAVARALGADPAKALLLGKDANERNVETMDLSRYRIVAFATHGLLPGDLDGLTQPALALTAPEIAGVEGDGLLTLEKILPLKLDADWVVLSACNTAAGAGAGAEAASGLGRAFFYAGTRALLITNWSVHSASARELISDIFRRQAADPRLLRAEALRQAMMAMMDGEGFVDDAGKTLFAYAHPLFWAPYSIMGDGN
jgi:CHAT domain-containing protein/tetratricopeptide (TPR) repeat protein